MVDRWGRTVNVWCRPFGWWVLFSDCFSVMHPFSICFIFMEYRIRWIIVYFIIVVEADLLDWQIGRISLIVTIIFWARVESLDLCSGLLYFERFFITRLPGSTLLLFSIEACLFTTSSSPPLCIISIEHLLLSEDHLPVCFTTVACTPSLLFMTP